MQAIGWLVLVASILGLVLETWRYWKRDAKPLIRLASQAVLLLIFLELFLFLGNGANKWFTPTLVPPTLNAEELLENGTFEFYGFEHSGDSFATGNRSTTRKGNELRLVAFGDSFVRATGANYGQSLLPRVAAALKKETENRAIQVFNLGYPGMDFKDMECRYWDAGRLLSPDIVLWIFVLNDLQSPGGMSPNDLLNDHYAEGLSSCGLRSWQIPTRTIADSRSTRASTTAYQYTYDPQVPETAAELQKFEERIGRIIEDTQSREARFIFVIFPLLHNLGNYAFTAAHEELRRIVERQGGEVIDLAPGFIGRNAARLWVSPTDHHPNDYGHWLAAQTISDALKGTELPLSKPVQDTLAPEENPTNAGKLVGREPELSSIRKALGAAPDDPELALDLAEKQVEGFEMLRLRYDSVLPEEMCIGFQPFAFNVLRAAQLLRDRQDPEAEAVKERARALMDRYMNADPRLTETVFTP